MKSSYNGDSGESRLCGREGVPEGRPKEYIRSACGGPACGGPACGGASSNCAGQ